MGKDRPDPNIMQERFLFGGLTALFAVLGLMVPVFLYIAPVPIGALTYRQGMRSGASVAVIVALLSGLLISQISLVIITLFMLFLSLGLAIGGSMRENIPSSATLAIGTVITLLMFGALYFTSLNMLGANVIDDMYTQWAEMAAAERVGPDIELMLDGIRTVFPALTVMSAALFAFLNMWGVRRILVRRGDQVTWFPPFVMWRLPTAAAFLFIVVWVAHTIVQGGNLDVWLLNIAGVMRSFVLLFGIAVMLYFTREWGLHWALRTLLVLFAVFTPAGHGAMIVIGLLDAFFNVRYRMRNQD